MLDEIASTARGMGWRVAPWRDRITYTTPAGMHATGYAAEFPRDDAAVVRVLHVLWRYGPTAAVEEVLSRHTVILRTGKVYDLVAALRRNPEVPVRYKRPTTLSL